MKSVRSEKHVQAFREAVWARLYFACFLVLSRGVSAAADAIVSVPLQRRACDMLPRIMISGYMVRDISAVRACTQSRSKVELHKIHPTVSRICRPGNASCFVRVCGEGLSLIEYLPCCAVFSVSTVISQRGTYLCRCALLQLIEVRRWQGKSYLQYVTPYYTLECKPTGACLLTVRRLLCACSACSVQRLAE